MDPKSLELGNKVYTFTCTLHISNIGTNVETKPREWGSKTRIIQTIGTIEI